MNTMKQFRRQGMRLLVLMLTTMVSIAAVIIFYDPNTGRVYRMVTAPEFTGQTNVLFWTNNTLPPSVPTDWIFTNDVLRLMTHDEMTARDLEADYQHRLQLRADARFKATTDIALWASLKVLLNIANTNRVAAGQPAISTEEFIQLISDEIETQ